MLGLKIQALKDKQEDTSYLLHDLGQPSYSFILQICMSQASQAAGSCVGGAQRPKEPLGSGRALLDTCKHSPDPEERLQLLQGACPHQGFLPAPAIWGPSSSTGPSAGSDRTSDVAPEGAGDRVPGWALEPGLRAPPAGAPALLRAADSRWSRWAPLLPDLLQTRPRSL